MKTFTLLTAAALLAFAATTASAWDGPGNGARIERIRCTSSADRYVRCPFPTGFVASGVGINEFGNGNGRCVLGETWGYDSLSVWVKGDCGADFDGIAGPGVSQPVEPPSITSGAYKHVCETQTRSFLLAKSGDAWTRVQCKGPCAVVSYTYDFSGGNALCGWTIGADQATLSCRNPQGEKQQTVTATLECAR